jgi:hypothetical protein
MILQREMGKALQQRLGEVDRMEKLLAQRLSDLVRMETDLESRLGTLATVENKDKLPIESQTISTPRQLPSTPVNPNELWDKSTPTTIQGKSLRTWSISNPSIKRMYVLLKTDGRPLDADIELWQGPDNTPNKMKVYVEDGGLRTFSVFISTPRIPVSVCVKNTGHLEFPLYGIIGPDVKAGNSCLQSIDRTKGEIIQGGALRTYAFDYSVDSVVVFLKTDGRPLNARIELLQGPNNNKQVMTFYTEDGLDRPVLVLIQTPGSGNVVRIVNVAPVEFPLHASVAEHEVLSDDAYENDGIQISQGW